ncbi:hypothetical protein KY289_016595 [Solanum tuberosum]|nr:hypothetical protein KY289_016595 [Solanum tuberosum]
MPFFLLFAGTILTLPSVPEVPNADYEAKLSKIDLGWLRDTLVEAACRDRVYWATTEGITSTHWSPDAKRWMHLVSKKIRPLGNRIDVTFPQVLVVACAMQGIKLNVGALIISEWKMFYKGNKKAFFLPRLVTTMCKQPSTQERKRRKVDGADNSRAVAEADDGGKDDDEADDALPTQS